MNDMKLPYRIQPLSTSWVLNSFHGGSWIAHGSWWGLEVMSVTSLLHFLNVSGSPRSLLLLDLLRPYCLFLSFYASATIRRPLHLVSQDFSRSWILQDFWTALETSKVWLCRSLQPHHEVFLVCLIFDTLDLPSSILWADWKPLARILDRGLS